MRVLLTSVPATQEFSPLWLTEKREPLGLGFIAADLEAEGHEVRVEDPYLDGSSTARAVMEFEPDMVGVYVCSPCCRNSLKLMREVRALAPGVKIAVGGPHAWFFPEDFEGYADVVVSGEGEGVLGDKDLIRGGECRLIKSGRVKSLDDLEFPDWKHFVGKPYPFEATKYLYIPEKPMFSFSTSRGCPYVCKFCSACQMWGNRQTVFSVDKVIAKLVELRDDFGMRSVIFREDNFTVRGRWLREFCSKYKEAVGLPWLCEGRVDSLDEELVEWMSGAGCRGIYLGVESGSQRVLDLMKKNITVEQIRDAARVCKKWGIKVYMSMMYGFPGEEDVDRELSRKLIAEVRPDFDTKAVFLGIPRSVEYDRMLEEGDYLCRDFQRFVYPKNYVALVREVYGGGGGHLYVPGNNVYWDGLVEWC